MQQRWVPRQDEIEQVASGYRFSIIGICAL
jgi:hypothetical protein